MKVMQDKDFDKVFSDALKDLEEVPPGNVWAGIARRSAKPKRSYTNLSIAASLLVMLSVGLWFYTSKPKEVADTTAQIKAAKRIREARPEEWHQQALEEQQKVKNPTYAVRQPIRKNIPQKEQAMSVGQRAEQRRAGKEEQEFRETFARHDEPVAVEPDEQRVSLASAESVTTVKFATALNEPEKITVKSVPIPAERFARKRPVKSIGDLVNLVVAQVDKREDKIIQFTDNDGESTVTGINLGFINIQKAK